MILPSFVLRNPSYATKNARRLSSVKRTMRQYLEDHPACELTGRTKNLQVHHLVPVSVAPDLAGDYDNLITLAKPVHFWIAHGGNWKNYMTNIRELVDLAEIQRTVGVKSIQKEASKTDK